MSVRSHTNTLIKDSFFLRNFLDHVVSNILNEVKNYSLYIYKIYTSIVLSVQPWKSSWVSTVTKESTGCKVSFINVLSKHITKVL